VVEDIGGFLRAMPELPATVEAANKILKADHGVTVAPRMLSQVFQMIEKRQVIIARNLAKDMYKERATLIFAAS